MLPLVRRLSHQLDPLQLFARVADSKHALLLETADTVGDRSPRSLIVPRAALVLRGRGREVRVEALSASGGRLLSWLLEALAREAEVRSEESAHGTLVARYPEPPPSDAHTRLLAPGPVSALRALRRLRLLLRPAPLSHLLAGVFAWDLLGAYEALPAPLSGADAPGLAGDDFTFWLPESLIVVEERALRVCAFAYGCEDPALCQRAVHDASGRVEELSNSATQLAGQRPLAIEAPKPLRDPIEVSPDDATFAGWVDDLKERIRAGDVFQIVPSRRFRAPCPRPLQAYARLRELNPSPYMFLVRDAEVSLFGASPETAVRVGGNPREVEIRPIAGTTRRGRDAAGALDVDLDGRLEVAMRLSEKEMAEHVMLIDLARNDVARVSQPGTRFVPRICGVDRYSHVSHLVSHVRGRLAPQLDALHAYVSSMNMGTLVGAPKLRAAELLRELEPIRRGPYGGAVGYLADDGSFDSAIVIRSALVREGVATVQAGAGVVFDSDPRAEAEETTRKAWAVLRALGAPELERAELEAVPAPEPSPARAAPAPPAEPRAPTQAAPRVEDALQPGETSVLLIDNFDSFTFNLADDLARRGCQVHVWRNDLPATEAFALALSLPAPRMILLSPGPGAPGDAGCCEDLVRLARGQVPLLGICLGHQAIVTALGGVVGRAPTIVHGKSGLVRHEGRGLFAGLPDPMPVGRYHSLAATRVPEGLEVSARLHVLGPGDPGPGQLVMAVEDRPGKLAGLQFHPESILTPEGGRLLDNALAWAAEGSQ